jgi:putative transposase
MRRARLLAPPSASHAIYHCISRVVDRRFVFGEVEKEQFIKYTRLYEELCGVRVLTLCVMGNHFHLLVEVPPKPAELPTEEVLLDLVRRTHGRERAQSLQNQFERWRGQDNVAAIASEMERWFSIMWDLGRFMKVVKQRFTQWYNGRQPVRRTGTLWEGRYRSVVVESGFALQSMAMYIDLNPVRAGLVQDPKDYRFSGYGEAASGQRHARERLARVGELSSPALARGGAEKNQWMESTLCWYRGALFGRGEERRGPDGQVIAPGVSPDEARKVRDAGGRLPLHLYLRLQVRYLTDGAVIGTKTFVETVLRERHEWFPENRRSGASRLKGLEHDCVLRSVRNLRIRPIEQPLSELGPIQKASVPMAEGLVARVRN